MGEQISVPVALLKELLRDVVESGVEHCAPSEQIEAYFRDLCSKYGVSKEDAEKFFQWAQESE